ncbi:MAG: hypothetical protein P1V36_09655 [Planctomycetota bacterium]|nr:hypothetical protein [Planctomycetota bacterium]
MARRPLALLLCMAAILACSACSSRARSEPLKFGVRPFARTGPGDGYWQTPRGGAPGSSSARRPTFKEAGITNSQEYGLDAHVDWGHHRLKIGASRQVLAGDATLTEDLTSQATFFPAGTAIDTDSAVDWLQAHYQYRVDVPMGRCDCLKLWPGVGYKWASLHHVFEGDTGGRVSRHHAPGMPNVLLDWEWRPRSRGHLRFSGSAAAAITTGDEPRRNQVIEVLGRAHYDFGNRGGLFLETGYRDVVLRDDQPRLQNHLNLDFGPWIGLGGEVRF